MGNFFFRTCYFPNFRSDPQDSDPHQTDADPHQCLAGYDNRVSHFARFKSVFRIRIRLTKMKRIQSDPDPKHWFRLFHWGQDIMDRDRGGGGV